MLPGGRGDVTNPASQCPATARTWTGIDASFPARGKVRCYTGSDNVAARSLTIVRLDNGKVIRTFRQASTEIVLPLGTAQTKLRARTTDTNLDSPITGQPVAFPAGAGAIADRVFVGDQDGRLWKVNLASTNPANWTMNLFFDTYPASYGSDPAFPNAYNDGQPLQLAPVLSVDGAGDVTVNVATGDQDTIGASSTMKNFIWSLTEKTASDRTTATSQVNWFKALTGGERVVGPMALFNSALYFASYAPPGVLGLGVQQRHEQGLGHALHRPDDGRRRRTDPQQRRTRAAAERVRQGPVSHRGRRHRRLGSHHLRRHDRAGTHLHRHVRHQRRRLHGLRQPHQHHRHGTG